MSKCKRKKIERLTDWKVAQKAMRDARIKREKRRAANVAGDACRRQSDQAPEGWVTVG